MRGWLPETRGCFLLLLLLVVLFFSSVLIHFRHLPPPALATMVQTVSGGAIKDVAAHVRGGTDLVVTYGRGVTLTDGVELTKAQALHAPQVKFSGKPGSLYTLLMVDPDAPSPDAPKMREWLHWFVTNIPGDSGDPSKGHVVAAYEGPAPPRGKHRYILLLYDQAGGEPIMVPHVESRGKFSASHTATVYGLGDPLAATFFYTSA